MLSQQLAKLARIKKPLQLIIPRKNKTNTMPIQQLNSVQTQLCCYISFSIKKTQKHFLKATFYYVIKCHNCRFLPDISFFKISVCVLFIFHPVTPCTLSSSSQTLTLDWVLLSRFSLNTRDSFAVCPCLQPSFPARFSFITSSFIFHVHSVFPSLHHWPSIYLHPTSWKKSLGVNILTHQ